MYMKRFLNKALFYKEIKNSLPFLFIMIFFSLAYVMSYFAFLLTELYKITGNIYNSLISCYRVRFTESINTNTSIGFIFFCSIIIFIAGFLISSDRNNRGYETLSSMNFKREQIIITKWICGTAAIVIPFTIVSFYVIFKFMMCPNAYIIPDAVPRLFQWWILNTLVVVFIFTFMMLIECLSSRPIFAAAVGSIFLILPVALPELIFSYIYMFIFQNKPVLIILRYYRTIISSVENNLFLAAYNVNYEGRFAINALVLLMAIIICFVLMVYAFKEAALEKIGYPILFEPLKPIFKIGVSACFAMTFSLFAYGIEDSLSHDFSGKISIAVIVLIVSGIITYFVTNKLIKMSEN